MKKITFVAAMAFVAVSFIACGQSSPKASLKSEVDTLSYAIGMAQTQGLREYLEGRLGVDSSYMNQFIKGLNEGVNAGDDKSKNAYYAGLQIGQQIANQMVKGINTELFGDDSTKTISLKNFMAGFISGTMNKRGLMTIDQAQTIAQTKFQAIKKKEMEKKYGPNKAAGEKYVADFAKQKDVKKLEGGVLYKVLKEGTGEIPADTSMVSVNYEGKTIDGKVFDSSYERKQPLKLRANQVIKGWSIALTHMPVGSKWLVVIPQDQAYGEREQQAIKPFSALIFTVELLGIEK